MPEKLFIDTSTCNLPGASNPDPNKPACAQGVSAVKALALAAAQGQKIYTLNQQNQAYHASIVQSLGTDEDTKFEISNALAAGKEVTVHQADINVSGWTGSGYVILDPDTGAGAYKISGGANGGVFSFVVGSGYGALAFLALFLGKASLYAGMVGALGTTAAIAGILVAIMALSIAITALMVAYSTDDRTFGCFLGGFLAPFALVVSAFLGPESRVVAWLGILYSGNGILQCVP